MDPESPSPAKHVPLTYDAGPFKLAVTFPKQHLYQAIEYKHQPGDLFVLTYPKNGTTWTQQLVYSILNDGQSAGGSQLAGKFIEHVGLAAVSYTGSNAIKCHILPDLIWSKTHPEAKYIIVLRNPKATCVSHFHHTRGFPSFHFQDGSFDVFFDLFMTGDVEYGSYFTWITSAIKHRHDDNVLFLTYEFMKKDTEAAAHRIAQFLSTSEQDFGSRFVHDHEYRSRILKHASVSCMRKHINEEMRALVQKSRWTGSDAGIRS